MNAVDIINNLSVAPSDYATETTNKGQIVHRLAFADRLTAMNAWAELEGLERSVFYVGGLIVMWILEPRN